MQDRSDSENGGFSPEEEDRIKLQWGIAAIVVLLFVGLHWFSEKQDDYALNLFTEVISIGITVLVLDRLAKRREQQALEAQLKRRMRSRVRDVAVSAVEELYTLGYFHGDGFKGADLHGVQWTEAYLEGANLEKAFLHGANLQGAWLQEANLQEANLSRAKLQGAWFWEANLYEANLSHAELQGANLSKTNLQDAGLKNVKLQGAFLHGANLQRANLWDASLQGLDLMGANLQGADLSYANLQGADLRNAKLQGANLDRTNLQEAKLSGAKFDETTTLPDGTAWTSDIDMLHFTDPDHPDFWRSDKPWPPAYQGDENEG